MQTLLTVAHVLGGLLMVLSLGYLPSLAWSLFIGDGAHMGFIKSALIVFCGSGVLTLVTWRYRCELQARDGCLLVVLAYAGGAAVCALPLLFELPGLSFTDAYFEALSGLTTTGATVLSGLDQLPSSLNLWRHLLQWVGGMGVILLAIAILPLLGVGGMQLFRAEAPGPRKEGKLAPRVAQTARYLWFIYIALTVSCMLALRWAGMGWFDAVCHAFSTIALGGFSTHDASIAHFGSLRIEVVLAIFMMMAVLNFGTHFLALRHRSLLAYWHDTEAKHVWLLILSSALMLGLYMWAHGFDKDPASLARHVLFTTISMATTTGFANVDFTHWPIFVSMWLLLLCAISSSAGSTGGGVKMIRVLVLVRQAHRELKRIVHPRAVAPIRISGAVIENRVILAVLGFMLLYGVTITALSFVLMASGLSFPVSVSAIIACVNNTGPGLEYLGPAGTYGRLNDFQIWVCALAMLAGRLELLALFALFMPQFWRK